MAIGDATTARSTTTTGPTSSCHPGGGGSPAELRSRGRDAINEVASTAAAPSLVVVQEPPGRDLAASRAGLASPIDWGSHGLGGLAAVLASQGEDRLALHAVVTALLAAGIGEPTGLALVGCGDVLPQDAVDEILEGVGLLTQQRHGVSISAPADHEDHFD